MFKKTACKITQRLCEKGIISESDFDLYEYGFNMGITVLLNLISTIVIGVIVGKVFESIAFLVFYIPLRSYVGGYHASTPRRCYFISIVIIMAMLLFIGYVDLSIIYIILLLVGMVVCFAFAPVEDKNKSLDRDEISVFKKRAYLILSIEFFIWLAVSVIFQPIEKTIPIVMFTESLMLVIGKLKLSKYS